MKVLDKLESRKGFKNEILNGVYIFFIFQLLSLLGYFYPVVSVFIFFLIAAGTMFISFYKVEYGFLILVFEFFAGHGGHLFEFSDVSLRTALFLIVISAWLFDKIARGRKKKVYSAGSFLFARKNRENRGCWPNPLFILFSFFLFLVFWGLINGIIHNNDILAIKDFMNYWYIFLFFPLVDFLKKPGFKEKIFSIGKSGIVGISLLTFIVFIIFVSNLAEVHDPFYWWWRDVVIGKATYTGNNFFRIVTPSHILAFPALLICLGFLSAFETGKKDGEKRKKTFWLAILASLAIVIDFSRAYFLGLFVGLIFLLKGLNWRRWLVFSLTAIVVLVLEFGFLYALVSGGQALRGLEYFKERMRTIFSPNEELSSLTRMNILPDLMSKIKERPIFGRGLGAEVSYQNPLTGEQQTTFHLDWGYLEIWLELGGVSLLVYLSILFFIFHQGWQKIKSAGFGGKEIKERFLGIDRIVSAGDPDKRLIVGSLAGLSGLIVANLTGPFLFHPLGIFYLILVAAMVNNYQS